MIAELVPTFDKLTHEEKWLLMEEMQQRLLEEENDATLKEPLRSEIVGVLEARLKEYEADPSLASPWSEVRRRLQSAIVRR